MISSTQSGRRFDEGIEHALQIKRRATDSLENLRGSGLLGQRFVPFTGELGNICLNISATRCGVRLAVRLQHPSVLGWCVATYFATPCHCPLALERQSQDESCGQHPV
jgi:hypothetical protein